MEKEVTAGRLIDSHNKKGRNHPRSRAKERIKKMTYGILRVSTSPQASETQAKRRKYSSSRWGQGPGISIWLVGKDKLLLA